MYETLVAALRNVNEYDSGYAKLMYDAADAIEELTRENESLAKSVNEASEILHRRWIPVTERLPECGERVLISNGKGFVCEAYLSERKRWMRHGCYMDYMQPTYWMPLPEPPKEE